MSDQDRSHIHAEIDAALGSIDRTQVVARKTAYMELDRRSAAVRRAHLARG